MVTLCQANGHPEARHYPVPMLWREARLVRAMVNKNLADNAVLTQIAIASVLSEKAGKAFSKQIKKLTES